MTPDQAAEFLHIELPTSLNALKRAFHRRSLMEHPDQSKHPQAFERFLRVKDAYATLAACGEALEVSGEDLKVLTTVDGKPLAQLGLGLGPTTNGRSCPACQGKGYSKTLNSFEGDPCPDCMPKWVRDRGLWGGHQEYIYRCRRCGGDGQFKRNGKVVGVCHGCLGGWVTPKRPHHVNRCVTCGGKGVIPPKGHHPFIYHTCLECKGVGELMVFNPVLPKGLLVGGAVR